MIVWLSTYPRAGNSLLRLMLYRVWGLTTHSVYSDYGDLNDLSVAERTGHRSLGRPFAEAYEELTASEQVHYVKTHEIPTDSQRAIYVVRDGRAASRSYFHYRREFNGFSDDAANLRDVLLGFTPYGSWSNHLDAWDPCNRPGTLLLKYEHLLEEPASQIAKITAFLGREPLRAWRNDFGALSQIEPRYFRAAGTNRPESALRGADAELFWALHGHWMRRMGYASDDDAAARQPEVSPAVRDALYRAIADQHGRLIAHNSRADHLAAELHQRDVELRAVREQLLELRNEAAADLSDEFASAPRRVDEPILRVARSA